ncbi:MAG: MATE family efflux transporter [Spirochaetaceae bacterium]|nr:MAG: MATE family efflux transporter [Spirochaetaceae bacterium]
MDCGICQSLMFRFRAVERQTCLAGGCRVLRFAQSHVHTAATRARRAACPVAHPATPRRGPRPCSRRRGRSMVGTPAMSAFRSVPGETLLPHDTARRRFFGDLSFVPRLVALALPIAGQHLLMTTLNLTDTLMVGQLGEVQIGAIALGNQVFFLLMLFLFGVGSGGAVFSSQYWGRRDVAGVRRSMGLSLALGSGGALVFTVGGVFFPGLILSVFTRDPAVIAEGIGYLRIVALSYVFTSISMGYAHALRSVGDTRLPLYATAVSITLNIAGNYVLIFGALGFPALGVRGAAIATALARLVELIVILSVVYHRKGPVAASLRELVRFDRAFAARYFHRALPVIFNEVFWSVGYTMYTVVFGRMGTSYLAAYTISDTVGRLALVFFIGTANASAILIGNRIGEDAGIEAESLRAPRDETPAVPPGIARDPRDSIAQGIALSLLKILPLIALVLGAIIFFPVASWVPYLFAVSDDVRWMVTLLMRAFAFVMIFKIFNMHIIVGILRGGGDTHYSLAIDVSFLWLVGVPMAFLTGLVLGLPVHLVYLCIGVEELGKMVLGANRIVSGRWINDLTEPVEALHDPVPDASDATGFPL